MVWPGLLLLLLAVVGATLLWSRIEFGRGVLGWPGAPATLPAQSQLFGAALEPAVDLPALRLVRSDGRPFTTADTRGRLSLFFFGYTHCADVCPLTLSELSQLRRGLGDDASRLDMYFVTLDPARDTPERLQAYVANFPGVIGLIGSDTQLSEAQSTFHVVAVRQDLGGGDYAIDHTAATYLVNADSQIQLVYPYGTAPDELAADLHHLAHALPTRPQLVSARARAADVGDTRAVYVRAHLEAERSAIQARIPVSAADPSPSGPGPAAERK